MPKKRIPQKSSSIVQAETTSRFNDALKFIDEGVSKKQAALSAGMDPRTFNKHFSQLEQQGTKLEAIDKKGHYRLAAKNDAYANWQVFWTSGEISTETLDYQNSLIMSKYWNTVQSALAGRKDITNFSPAYVENIYGVKIPLQRDYQTIQYWHSRLVGTTDSRFFNENVYERTAVVG